MSADTPQIRASIARQLSRTYRIDGLSLDDLRQEAELAMHLAYPDGGAEESHLRMVASRALSNHVRRVAEHRPQLQTGSDLPDAAIDAGPSAEEMAGASELVLEMLEHLTPQQQRVFKMTYLGGWGDAAIADALAVCEATVRRHRADAIATLREEGFEPEGARDACA